MKSPIAIVLAVFAFLSGSTVLAATVMKVVNADDDGMVKLMTIQQIVSGTVFIVFALGFAVLIILERRKRK